MKFANRKVAVLRKGDNIEMSGEFFKVAHVERFYTEIDLFDADHGNIAAPLAVAATFPVQNGIPVPEVVPVELNMLCHVLPVPLPTRVAIASLNGGPGAINEVVDHSFDLFHWQPQGQPRWLQPDGNGTGYIDHELSQKEDPNETWGLWCMENDIPAFQVRNKANVLPLIANILTLADAWIGVECWNYRIEPIPVQVDARGRVKPPSIYTPVPYVRTAVAEFADAPRIHDM